MIKKIAILSFAILVIAFLILHLYIYPSPPKFHIEDRTKPILIAHAGGAYEGKTYTNSLEAVEFSLKNGYDFIEIDLQLLTDFRIGGIHDITDFNKSTGFGETSDNLSSQEMRDRMIYGYLHPLLDKDIFELFNKSNAYLVTDKLENPGLLQKEIPLDKKKILIETFSYKSYLKHIKFGYDYPMLALGGNDDLESYWPLFLIGKVKIITFPIEQIPKCKEKLKELINKDITIFAFTANDKDFILRYGGHTVSGFYTDSITYKNLYE